MNKKTLSVVLATKNEEKNLSDCLKSVKEIASEIIIFDEESTDKTREIAKKLGAKVFLSKHEPIFHITKNKAINKAKSDWILQLDADERLTSELKLEITKLLNGDYFGYNSWISPLKLKINKIIPLFRKPQKIDKAASAYFLKRKNFFLTRYLKHTGQYPDPVIRLFQRGKAILPAKNVHEQMTVKGSVGWFESDLDHYATPEFSRYLIRENRYSTLTAKELYRQKIKITLVNTINYLFFKPLKTFLILYFRNRGFLDGFPGFVFSIYSGFHHAFSYIKLAEIYRQNES
jgi:glycosyltransferase involved in cell wall biosynthesis